MSITKIIATEENTPTTSGAASNISTATCVRLFNNQNATVTVSISPSVGAGTTTTFSMPAGSVEFLAKLGSDVIWTSAAIKANKVAFTN